ncbi:MAG: LLM class flavin-dependent oxidoreductase [Gammaproteobacteria bacterium]
MTEPIPLSVLDQSPVRSGGTALDAVNDTIALARHCERLGYRRFWVSEHHASGSLVGCAPEILLARLGAETHAIRLGSGGIMLPHYSPYKVAEVFKLLATMYPGRIDLGVGRAPGSDQYTAAALAYGSRVGAEYFPNKVQDLEALLRDAPPPTPGLEQARAFPSVAVPPVLWMLGSSPDSAHLAAALGLPYSVAHFINPRVPEDIFRTYRQRFQPSAVAERPHTSLGLFVLCADTEAHALRLSKCRDLMYLRYAQTAHGLPVPSLSESDAYTFDARELAFLRNNGRSAAVGTPEQVCVQLRAIAGRFGADELVIVTITHDLRDRLRSYELLAQAWPAVHA